MLDVMTKSPSNRDVRVGDTSLTQGDTGSVTGDTSCIGDRIPLFIMVFMIISDPRMDIISTTQFVDATSLLIKKVLVSAT